MKKALATLIALALPAAALAEAHPALRPSRCRTRKSLKLFRCCQRLRLRISAGYRINDLRFAVDYTRYKTIKPHPPISNFTASARPPSTTSKPNRPSNRISARA